MNPLRRSPAGRMLLPCFAALCFATAASAQTVAVDRTVVVPGALGVQRRVISETLILPGAASIVAAQQNRERERAVRETRRRAAEAMKQIQEEKRRAENEAIKAAGETNPLKPGDVEAAMAPSSQDGGSGAAAAGTTDGEASPSSAESAPSSSGQGESP